MTGNAEPLAIHINPSIREPPIMIKGDAGVHEPVAQGVRNSSFPCLLSFSVPGLSLLRRQEDRFISDGHGLAA
jgi:hypothetical protein